MLAEIPRKEAGWHVEVEWKDSTIEGAGMGCFAKQLIPKGAILRRGLIGFNVLKFESAADLPPLTKDTIAYFEKYIFYDCFLGMWVPGNVVNHTNCASRVNSSKHFLYTIKDEEGLQPPQQKSVLMPQPVFDNKYSIQEVHLVASRTIWEGEEILFNYESYNTNIPGWFEDIIKKNGVSINVKGFNDFMK